MGDVLQREATKQYHVKDASFSAISPKGFNLMSVEHLPLSILLGYKMFEASLDPARMKAALHLPKIIFLNYLSSL